MTGQNATEHGRTLHEMAGFEGGHVGAVGTVVGFEVCGAGVGWVDGCDEVGSNVVADMGSAVGSEVGSNVGAGVGCSVGAWIGETDVGGCGWVCVGLCVGNTAEGCLLGAPVGCPMP